MNRKALFVILGVTGALGVGVAIAVAHWARGTVFHFGLSGWSFWGAFYLGGAGLVCHQFAKQFDLKALRWAKGALLTLSFFLIFPMLSIFYGARFAEADVREAENFCRRQIFPFLEAHKEQTGSYPEKVEDTVRKMNNLPRLFRGYVVYEIDQDGQSFILGFSDPRTVLDYWIYDSSRNKWHRGDG